MPRVDGWPVVETKMAFFDFLLGGAGGQMKRHARRIANRDAQAEDREASAHWLAEKGTEEALLAMCSRFALQLEHGLKDRKEKDIVFELLAEHGPRGAAVARRWATENPNFHHAVRLVERIEGPEAAVGLLLDLLEAEQVDQEFKPEKKRNLLISLAERRSAKIVESAQRFLTDFDEGVRHAAIEALAAQEGDAALPHLARALQEPKEESTRIRGRLVEIFQQRKWPLPS
ncbi:MAG: HEAT repeat domain-containing protein [Pseudomonadota bacterium]|nr:HEAT repeat domain-containing protein [Pseudomonadota bacterium]